MNHQFDIALSFAGTERERKIAEALANHLQQLGLHVFFDRWYEHELIGREADKILQDVFETQSRYCIVLISKDYDERRWTQLELQAIQAREQGDLRDTLFPVMTTRYRPKWLKETCIYFDLASRPIEELVQLIKRRLESDGLSSILEVKLQQYLQRIQEETLQRYKLKENLFRWGIDVLPIQFKNHVPEPEPSWTIRSNQLLDQEGKLFLLIGSPGSGKTTACHRLKANPPPGLIPLDIKDVLLRDRQEALNFVAEYTGIDNLQFLESIECAGRLLFIADGIGEKRKVAKVVESLHLLVGGLPNSQFVVTCRTGDYEEDWLTNFQRWDILELDNAAQDEFLRTQPKELQQRVLQAFRTKPELRQICRNQFFFLMVVRLMAKDEEPLTVPTRVDLYKSFLGEFLTRWEKKGAGERQFIESYLETLAVEMRKSPTDRTWLAEDKVKEILHCHLPNGSDQDIMKQLRALYRTGLIEPVNGGIRFFQETFQEYLCAKWLATQNTQFVKVIRDLLDDREIRSFFDEIALSGHRSAQELTAVKQEEQVAEGLRISQLASAH